MSRRTASLVASSRLADAVSQDGDDPEEGEGSDEQEPETEPLIRPTKRRRGTVDRFVPGQVAVVSLGSPRGESTKRQRSRAGMGTGATSPEKQVKVEPVNLQQHLEILDAASDAETSDSSDEISFGEEEQEEMALDAGDNLEDDSIQALPTDVQKVLREIREQEEEIEAEELDEEEYEVEAIVESKLEGHGKDAVEMFLVKWKGWASSRNTWEPEENLGHAKAILKRFRAKEKEKVSFFPGLYDTKQAKKESEDQDNAGPSVVPPEQNILDSVDPAQRRRIAAVMRKLQKLDEVTHNPCEARDATDIYNVALTLHFLTNIARCTPFSQS